MSPVKQEKAKAHIEKMREKRESYLRFLNRINRADAEGRCYCRYRGLVCREHSRLVREEMERVFGQRYDYDALLAKVIQEHPIEEME